MGTGIDFAGVVEMVETGNWAQTVIGGKRSSTWDRSRWKDAAFVHQCWRERFRGETVDFSMFAGRGPKTDRNAKRRLRYALNKKAT